MKVALSVVLAVVAAFTHAPARACSIGCVPYIFPAKGTVPANLPGLSFGAMGSGFLNATLALTETLPDGTTSDVPLEVDANRSFATLLRPLVVGASYHAHFVTTGASLCSVEQHPGVAFVAEPEAVWPPTTLGVVTLDPPQYGTRTVQDYTPACNASGEAVARTARLVLDAAARPWAEVLLVGWQAGASGFWVTSNAFEPRPTTATEIEVYRSCADDALPGGLTAGTHTLTVTAQIVGRTETASTSQDFDIACAVEPPEGDEATSEPEANAENAELEGVEPMAHEPADAGCGGAPAGSALLALVIACRRRARVVRTTGL